MRLADALSVAPVIAIVRLPVREGAERAVAAVVEGGVPAAEIALTTPGALDALTNAGAALGDAACLGAGSVRTPTDAARAYAATLAGSTPPVGTSRRSGIGASTSRR